MQIKKDTRVWVMCTDTVIGIHARVFDEEAKKRIYKIKQREKNKKFIVLIGSFSDLKKFGITPSKRLRDFLQKIWPGPVSVVIEGQAFRMPNDPELLAFLKKIGPVLSSSANLSGKETVKSISEAKKLFGEQIDEYLPCCPKSKKPSLVVEILRY